MIIIFIIDNGQRYGVSRSKQNSEMKIKSKFNLIFKYLLTGVNGFIILKIISQNILNISAENPLMINCK